MKKTSWLVVISLVLFSTLFVSCSGKSAAIKMVRTGYLDMDPDITINDVLKAYPERIGSIKWKVEEVIKQSKKEGGTVYIVSATFKHDTSVEALFTDYFGEVADNARFNSYMTHLLYGKLSESDEPNPTTERRVAIIDKVARMYIDTTYEYTGRSYAPSFSSISWYDENLPQLFTIDSLNLIVFFAALPQINYLELINFRYEFKISTDLLEKKDSFNITLEPNETSISNAIIAFRSLFYEGGTFGDTIYDEESTPVIRDEIIKEYTKMWDAMNDAQLAEEDRRAQEEKIKKIMQAEEQYKQDQKIAISKIDQRIEYFKSFIPENTPQEKIKELFIEPISRFKYKVPILGTIEELEMSKERINQSPTKFDENGRLLSDNNEHNEVFYYVNTPFEKIIPFSHRSSSTSLYDAYDALSEAEGNYYSTPLTKK
jgi:hypothetical protein